MTLPASPELSAPVEPSTTLEVSHLDVAYRVRGKDRLALRDVSFSIGRQESFGLVGESGCGKSTTALAVTRYLPRNGRLSAGSVLVNGQDPAKMDKRALRRFRARTISMVYQEPGRALNPSIRVGRQVAEVYEVGGTKKNEALARAEELLGMVQIADPGRVLRSYPHQLSGGMLQRIMIAMALASQPSLLILDEPTTALDATVEAEVLDLVSSLRQRFQTSVLFISHNLAVIAKMCDRVGVMYAGELVEQGPALPLLTEPRHPYTIALLKGRTQGAMKKGVRLETIGGAPPDLSALPPGCAFAPRCAHAIDRCLQTQPEERLVGNAHSARCIRVEEIAMLQSKIETAPTH